MNAEVHRPYEGLIPAGGKGSRLYPVTFDRLPKPLVKVGGKELIRYSIDSMPPNIVKRILIVTDHHSDQIDQWVSSQTFTQELTLVQQTEPDLLGAVSSGVKALREDEFVSCNGDEIRTGLNMQDLIYFHEKAGTLATMVVAYADHLVRHRTIEIRERDSRITGTVLNPKEHEQTPASIGLVNAGIIVMNKRAEDFFDPNHSHGWSGIIDPLCDARQLTAYVVSQMVYFNVGTPEEYAQAQAFFGTKPSDSSSFNLT